MACVMVDRHRQLDGHGPTIGSYIAAFAPMPGWEQLATWPPDVFAVANLLLDATEAYRFAVAPPSGRRWPPPSAGDWGELVRAAAAAWRRTACDGGVDVPQVPDVVAASWKRLLDRLDMPLALVRRGEEACVWEDLLTLHAMADEACSALSTAAPDAAVGPFERAAWAMLDATGTLSRLDPARVRITPKTHFPGRGITIRSLSRYLALCYESIDLRWRRIVPASGPRSAAQDLNLVLLPWPLEIDAVAFRPVQGPLENMDPSAFGFFAFQPEAPLDLDLLSRMVENARRHVPRVDAVILPEAAVEAEDIGPIEAVLDSLEVVSLMAGVRGRPGASGLGQNYVHLGVRDSRGWQHFSQAKHHRWCLDEGQIRQYHLGRVLDPGRFWWEAIELPPRTLEIIDLGNGAISAPLVCEDLARLDEVSDLVRRIGPALVVALLLDGPQLPSRWSCRYASVLADEPGSTVLTLTSLGMALRSRPPGFRRSRVVAMWSDPMSGLTQIDLARGASGVLLRASAELKTVWTADGRRHERTTPSITLSEVRQLRVPRH